MEISFKNWRAPIPKIFHKTQGDWRSRQVRWKLISSMLANARWFSPMIDNDRRYSPMLALGFYNWISGLG